MGKDKIRRFAENATFRCVVQPGFEEVFRKDYALKGKWNRDFFGNDRPIEQRFLQEGLPITYLRFGLGDRREFETIPFAPDEALLSAGVAVQR